MRALLILLGALIVAPAAAAPVDRLREVEAARAQAARDARMLTQRATLIEDRALRQRAEAEALSARIAEAESRLESSLIRKARIAGQVDAMQIDLAVKQAPLSRMFAALQRLARRPALLMALGGGDMRDFAHARAMMGALEPHIAHRTSTLRSELAQLRSLSDASRLAEGEQRQAQQDLSRRRAQLVALSAQDRIDADRLVRRAGAAHREVTVRGAQARSISAMVEQQERDVQTAAALRSLPAPPAVRGATERLPVQLPAAGALLSGYGERDAAGGRSRGLTIAPRPGAQIMAPLAGEVAYAGLFRGYGMLVIIRHPSQLISIVAGMAELSVEPGQAVEQGAVLGHAGDENPRILYEMRRDRRPVHPLLLR